MLNRPLFDVNMRLYKNNVHYRTVINDAIRYMVFVLKQKFNDYGKLKGISGANLGIPWNIIAYYNNSVMVMINPKITEAWSPVKVLSNCGSLRLPESIKVERHAFIICEWYDTSGQLHKKEYDRDQGSLTIQHEVEHNQGVLITQKGL